MPATPALVVGIDIAAKTFVAAWLQPGTAATPAQTFAQPPVGMAALHRQLQGTQVPVATTLVVLEATGSSWITLATTLH